jgi:hypothetical protein
MTEDHPQIPESQGDQPRFETDEHAEKRFRGWRLLGIILGVVVVLAAISFAVDWLVIGPLEGRVF